MKKQIEEFIGKELPSLVRKKKELESEVEKLVTAYKKYSNANKL